MSKSFKLLLSSVVLVSIFVLCSGFVFAASAKVGVTKGDSVNLRESPKTTAKVLKQLDEGTKVIIVEVSDSWYKVNVGDLTGWIYSEYVSVSDVSSIGTGTINGDKVNVRSGPSKLDEVITRLNDGDKVSLLAKSSDWYNIKTSDGTCGWVNEDFILLKNSKSSRGDEDRSKAVGSANGEKVIEYAKKFLGVKYVYGGTSPSGFDCSGFTLYVYSHFGIDLERVASSQAKQGDYIKKANLQAGDLVFFDTDGGHNYINHAGIYIGDGNFIEASSGSSTHKVIVANLDSGFYANAYMTARRVLN